MTDFFTEFTEFISLKFVWMALLTSFFVSIISAVAGSICVANKSVFFAGGVAHSAFGGVGVAFFLGFTPIFGALGFALGFALILSLINRKFADRMDAYIGALWAFGMALGVVLIDLTPGYNADINSYLFGSIIAVSDGDFALTAGYAALLLGFVIIFYERIIFVLYDEQFCKTQGMRTAAVSAAVFVFVALGVVMSMSVAGLILVLAVLSIPAYIADLWANSLKSMMFLSFFVSLVFMWGGFLLACWLDVSPGACIVLLLCVGMIFALALKFSKFSKKVVR